MHWNRRTNRPVHVHTTYANTHITHTYPLPHLKPDGQSKLQSYGTQGMEHQSKGFWHAQQWPTATAYDAMCRGEMEKRTDRQRGNQRERERHDTETQLPTVEWYCTVYKRPEEKRDLKASAQSALYLCLSKSASHFYSSFIIINVPHQYYLMHYKRVALQQWKKRGLVGHMLQFLCWNFPAIFSSLIQFEISVYICVLLPPPPFKSSTLCTVVCVPFSCDQGMACELCVRHNVIRE